MYELRERELKTVIGGGTLLNIVAYNIGVLLNRILGRDYFGVTNHNYKQCAFNYRQFISCD